LAFLPIHGRAILRLRICVAVKSVFSHAAEKDLVALHRIGEALPVIRSEQRSAAAFKPGLVRARKPLAVAPDDAPSA
jgi:hypothetical protein